MGEAILLVDDDDRFRNRLAAELRRLNHRVTAAANYDEAVREIIIDAPRLAVLDLRLADRSGLEVLEELRRRVPTARAVVLSGYGSIADAVESVRMGACDFLCKPVSADAVLRKLIEDAGAQKDAEPNIPSLAQVEWEHIARVLADCGGSVSRAAKQLGIHRRSLQRKMRRGPPTH
jgi:two-component system, response regulator RegA